MDRGRRTLRAEELARDVQGLASHNDDFLAVEQLLGDRGGQATEKVALAVDDLREVLADAVLPLCGRARNLRSGGGAGVAVTAMLWIVVIVWQGRTYNDGFECRHGCCVSESVVVGSRTKFRNQVCESSRSEASAFPNAVRPHTDIEGAAPATLIQHGPRTSSQFTCGAIFVPGCFD